jgi:hypothetical protein
MITARHLQLLAHSHAEAWLVYGTDLCELVDILQEFAAQTGLVAAIGQDAVQAIIAAPFARLRALAAEQEAEQSAFDAAEDEAAWQYENDYAARLVRQWELADPRDRWRHTGEVPPPREPAPQVRKPKKGPAASTVMAFEQVVRLGDANYLAEWLLDHPEDAAALLAKLQEAA